MHSSSLATGPFVLYAKHIRERIRHTCLVCVQFEACFIASDKPSFCMQSIPENHWNESGTLVQIQSLMHAASLVTGLFVLYAKHTGESPVGPVLDKAVFITGENISHAAVDTW